MKNWTPSGKLIKIYIALCLVGALLYAGGLYMVLNGENKIKSLLENTESQSSREEKLSLIKNLAVENQSQINNLRSYYIQKGDEVAFIENVEEIGRTSSVTYEIISIDVKPSTNGPFKEDINLHLSVKGTWQNIMIFMDRLEKTYFGLTIQTVNMENENGTAWTGSIEFTIYRNK